MNKPHKHAELIHKWADGAEIEFKDEADGKWKRPPGVPQWNEATEYRIKPEPQYPKTSMSDQQIMSMWATLPQIMNLSAAIRYMMNKAIEDAINAEQVIIGPGQIEG